MINYKFDIGGKKEGVVNAIQTLESLLNSAEHSQNLPFKPSADIFIRASSICFLKSSKIKKCLEDNRYLENNPSFELTTTYGDVRLMGYTDGTYLESKLFRGFSLSQFIKDLTYIGVEMESWCYRTGFHRVMWSGRKAYEYSHGVYDKGRGSIEIIYNQQGEDRKKRLEVIISPAFKSLFLKRWARNYFLKKATPNYGVYQGIPLLHRPKPTSTEELEAYVVFSSEYPPNQKLIEVFTDEFKTKPKVINEKGS